MSSFTRAFFLMLLLAGVLRATPGFDTKKIEDITGLKGAYTEKEGGARRSLSGKSIVRAGRTRA